MLRRLFLTRRDGQASFEAKFTIFLIEQGLRRKEAQRCDLYRRKESQFTDLLKLRKFPVKLLMVTAHRKCDS